MPKEDFPGGWRREWGPFALHWTEDWETVVSFEWERGWLFWVECGRYTLGLDPLWFKR